MLYIGKVANTHGIKGEIKIISKFKYKDEVFSENNIIYINEEKLIIKSYRKHKEYDMVVLSNYNDINEVLKFKGKGVYIDEGDYTFSGVLNENLIGMKAYASDSYLGSVKRVEENASRELLVLEKDSKEFLIPYNDFFVKVMDDKIEINLIKGLIDED